MAVSKTTKINVLETVLTALNFFIPFNGLMIALENHLKADRMPLTYIMLLGLIAGIIMTLMLFILKDRNIKTKIAGTVILLFAVIGINFMVP